MSDEPNPIETRNPSKYYVVDADNDAPGEYCDTPDEAGALARKFAQERPGHFIDIYHHTYVVCCRRPEPESDV